MYFCYKQIVINVCDLAIKVAVVLRETKSHKIQK